MWRSRYLPPSATPGSAPTNAAGGTGGAAARALSRRPGCEVRPAAADRGSPFQRRVWEAMCAIPRGRTLHLRRARARARRGARAPSARRAATTACRSSSPAIASSPRTASAASRHATGGYLLEVKRWLLAHEAPAFELTAVERTSCSTRSATRCGSRTACRSNTISSYRADLEQLGVLPEEGSAQSRARATCLLSSPRARAARRARRGWCRRSSASTSTACASGASAPIPTLKLDPPKRAPRFPKIPVRSRRRGAARRAGHGHAARPARPRDARDALCHRPARLGAGRAQDLRGEPRCRRGARHRQGLEGAAGAARRGGGRLDLRAISKARSEDKPPTRCSSPAAAPA